MFDKYYIIDEVSMLDMELANILFKAIPTGSLVILVGDIDQLPSVGPGDVLNDLINAGIPTYRLEGSFRQENGSCIVENAQRVKQGISTLIEKDDFTIIHAKNEEEAIKMAAWTAAEGAVLLTPLRKTVCGSVELSNEIQSLLNRTGAFKLYGKTAFYKNDKVIATDNNYQLGFFNGEYGIVTEISDEGLVIQFSKKIIFVPNSFLGQIVLAYAITIHKSQGAEFNRVTILLSRKSMRMLQMNLLYTAITRAKKEVTIITEDDCLETAINNKRPIRQTGLTNRIKQNMKNPS